MHSKHLWNCDCIYKATIQHTSFVCQIWRQFVYISKRGIDEQKVRQYFASMLYAYMNNVYTYMQYMLKRLGTIAGYECISCSCIFIGVLGSWRFTKFWPRLWFLAGSERLSQQIFRVRFSSLQQQTQHIICVSIADHSRRWLLPRSLISKSCRQSFILIELYFMSSPSSVIITRSEMHIHRSGVVASKNSWGEC